MGTSVLIEIEVSDDDSNNSFDNGFNNNVDNIHKFKANNKGNIENFFDIVMKEEREKEIEKRIKIIG